jgi:LysR family transcriptional regulator, glycine cleavage system transcriptional activator
VPVCAPQLLDRPPDIEPADPRWLESQTALLHHLMPDNLPIWLAGMGFAALRPRRIEIYDSGSLMLEAAANGLGIGFLLDMTVEHALAEGRLIEPFQARIKSPVSFGFVARETAIRDKALVRFHAWLVTQADAQDEK